MNLKHNNKCVIALVGGISSGKSTVAAYLDKKGAIVIDGDEIGHNLLCTPLVLHEIFCCWPQVEAATTPAAVRACLAKIVFKSSKELAKLQKIMFPRIGKKISEQIEANKQGLVLLDVPMLFEAGWDVFCDEIWFINTPRNTRIQNFCQRYSKQRIAYSLQTGMPIDVSMNDIKLAKKDFVARELMQLPLAEKLKKSTQTIDNSGSFDETAVQLDAKWDELVEKLWEGLYR